MTTDTDTFTHAGDFAHSTDRMWHLITNPAMRDRWSAPGDHVVETLSSDLRVGGVDHQRCGPADNPEFEATTRCYNLAPPTDAAYIEVIEACAWAQAL
jgi:uncharacterized protein YndB with AHSA1/START domain